MMKKRKQVFDGDIRSQQQLNVINGLRCELILLDGLLKLS